MKSKKPTEGEPTEVSKPSRKRKAPEKSEGDVGEKADKPQQKPDKPLSRELLEAVYGVYERGGWQLLRGRGINDLIAAKDSKYHFVQVLTDEIASQPKFNGEQRNIFIQNAFANSATPVYAYVQTKQTVDENGERCASHTVTFRDINTGGRVIIRAKNSDV